MFSSDSLEPHADLEGEAPDGSFAHSNGRHAVGHVDDHGSLQQQVLEARVLVQRMEAALTESLDSALIEKVKLRPANRSSCQNQISCVSLTGSGLQHGEDAALGHQDLAPDSGRGRLSAEDVLASGSAEQRRARPSPSEGSNICSICSTFIDS